MKQYLYETHMHTSQGSACSDTPGHAYIQPYIDAGYDGIIITDHFFRGNCAVDRSLPWRDRVRLFVSGFEDAWNEGEKRRFPVFFAWEENFEGDEYLIYGPGPDFLLEHPEMEHWSRKEQFEAVNAFGGAVIQAHPFRARGYISRIHLNPCLVHGIECANMGNEPMWDTLALQYGRTKEFVMTAGSDNHHAAKMTKENLAGVLLDAPLRSVMDYARILREHRQPGLHIPRDIPPLPEHPEAEKPLDILDENENCVSHDIAAALF